MKSIINATALSIVLVTVATTGLACTGITLRTTLGSTIPARTIEWAAGDIGSRYTIVPRGYVQRSYTPDGRKAGMEFKARYGYVGLAVEKPEFVVEGINEVGLSAGLFYFPAYGQYEKYEESERRSTISDLQLVSWILSGFSSIDELKQGLQDVHIVGIDERASTVHWRITEVSGKQIIIEIVGGKLRIHENGIGVLTNSPEYEWHITNLNNYVNLTTGTIPQRNMGGLTLKSFGGGSGMHGIPGDMTPPSRFVRAAIFQATAPPQETSEKAVMQAFHILSNFDIPIGMQFDNGQDTPDIPSATQWTVATDVEGRKIYYRTMYKSNIRCIDLNCVDFANVEYSSHPLDERKEQPVEYIQIQ